MGTEAAFKSENFYKLDAAKQKFGKSDKTSAALFGVLPSTYKKSTGIGHDVKKSNKALEKMRKVCGPDSRIKAVTDNILEGITKPSIRRLARRGGVKRISRYIYEETRHMLRNFL